MIKLNIQYSVSEQTKKSKITEYATISTCAVNWLKGSILSDPDSKVVVASDKTEVTWLIHSTTMVKKAIRNLLTAVFISIVLFILDVSSMRWIFA